MGVGYGLTGEIIFNTATFNSGQDRTLDFCQPFYKRLSKRWLDFLPV
jgi:hypothetical protein